MFFESHRYWFLTWTTYGTWLPGDERGFIGTARDSAGTKRTYNQLATPPARASEPLAQYAAVCMSGSPIRLHLKQSLALLDQFQETARHRAWLLSAVGIMSSHVHLVAGVQDNPSPEAILRDFKSYGSRRLNRNWGKPASDTWWTESGSKRKLNDEASVLAAIEYIRLQPNPLVIWIRGEGLIVPANAPD